LAGEQLLESLTVDRSHDHVRVEEEQVGSARGLRAGVARAAEADVLAALDQSRLWSGSADRGSRVVARCVVDDKDLGVGKGFSHRCDTSAHARS
jgi:hypothetical protein